MIDRHLEKEIRGALTRFPAVTMIGARQTGKSTLARKIAASLGGTVFDLENPRHRLVLEDPLAAFAERSTGLVVIDEAQRMGDLFPLLRVLIDENRRPGRLLLLGSASPDLRRQAAESLAGRNRTLILHPLDLPEVGAEHQNRLWMRGGLPPAFAAPDDPASLEWRCAYLSDLFERDLRLFGFDLPPERMRRFLGMLAHLHGRLWNASQLARSLGIGATTAARYLDIMQQTLLVKRLNPYYANLGKRLIKAPKVYLADSGLLHALLRLETRLDLMAHPVIGASWEGFVLQQMAAILPDDWETSFWRTSAGAEVDLLLLRRGRPFAAIECKANVSRPKPTKGFFQACEDLKVDRRWVVYPGQECLPLGKGGEVLSLAEVLVRLVAMARKKSP